MIPFLDLKKNYSRIKDEILENIQKNVLDNASYINGPSVEKFEKNFASYIGVDHCIGVANGTDALEIAVQALGIGFEDEVITQGNTFISTCLGVSSQGAKVVLVDHDEYFMLDHTQLEKKITSRTRAIIAVHLYGHSANMTQIMQIAKKHNLYVIEDVAQAHGAKFNNITLGQFGDISCFSFYPGKNLGAYGDGGAICTNNADLAIKIRSTKNLGSLIKYVHTSKGRNSRLDSIQAEILNTKLKYLDIWNESRRKIACIYDNELKDVEGLLIPKVAEKCVPVYHLYVIRVKESRDALRAFLHDKKIDTGIHYPIPVHQLEAYKELKQCILPNTTECASQILSLPIFPELTESDVKYICSQIKFFLFNTNNINK